MPSLIWTNVKMHSTAHQQVYICTLTVVTIHFDVRNKVSKERDERENPQKLHERGGSWDNSSGIGESNTTSSN